MISAAIIFIVALIVPVWVFWPKSKKKPAASIRDLDAWHKNVNTKWSD